MTDKQCVEQFYKLLEQLDYAQRCAGAAICLMSAKELNVNARPMTYWTR